MVTGITRDIANLIVLDIDVNCDTTIKQKVNRILLEFAKCGALPDFIIKITKSPYTNAMVG